MKIKPYQLAALVFSFGAHIWLGHAFVVSSSVQNAQKPNLVIASNILAVQLIKSGSIANSREPLLAKFDSLHPEDFSSHPPPVEDEMILPILSPPEPYYFRSHELTNPPRLLQDVRATQNLNLSGAPTKLAILRLLVSDSGDIDRVVVEESNLSAESIQFLIEKFSKMKFNPGKIDNLPVKSQLTIEVEADPSE